MGAPVARVAILRGFGAERTLLAETDGFELIARDAQRNEGIFGGGGTAVAQGQVIFGGATFVAMAFDGDDEVCVHLEDGFQRAGIALQNGLIFAANIALVVVEVDILHLFAKDLLDGGLAGG